MIYSIRSMAAGSILTARITAGTAARSIAARIVSQGSINIAKSVLLVTGGFHSQGMTQQLIHSGATVINYVPKLTSVSAENSSAYLSVFDQEKTPLEKLFEGQKLFLAFSRKNAWDGIENCWPSCAGPVIIR